MPEKSKFKTSVGGQAVMEGIMMRGPEKWCLAVRNPEGEIITETHDVQKRPWAKIPFVRGIFNFVDSLLMGYKTLAKSTEISMEGIEEEPSKFDRWIENKFGDAGMKVMMGVSTVLAFVLAMLLFMYLPAALVNLLNRAVPLGWGKVIIEGLIKVGIFVLYLALVSRMKEIHRVFCYHGAEHKTISCYEAGDELTVENIRTHTRFHPRCGTSFIFIVLIISILLNSLLPWPEGAGASFMRMGMKLLMLPVVMGVSYEILRLAGKYNGNPVMRALSAPGMWLQRLTTKEPDDSMIEVAITAVTPVLPEKPEDALYG